VSAQPNRAQSNAAKRRSHIKEIMLPDKGGSQPGFGIRAEVETLREIAPAFLSPVARNAGRSRLVLGRIERLAIACAD